MARILLNIDVNTTKASAEINKLTQSIGKMNAAQSGEGAEGARVGVDALRRSYANLLNTIRNAKGLFNQGIFDKTEAEARSGLEAVSSLNEEIKKNGEITKEDKKNIAELSKSYQRLSADFAQTRAEAVKLNKETVEVIPNVANVRKSLYTMLNQVQGAEKNYAAGTFDGIKGRIGGLIGELDSLNAKSPDYASSINKIAASVKEISADFAKARAEGKNMHGTLSDIVGGFMKFQLAAMLVMKPLQLLRDAISSVNETLVKTETTVVQIRRVLSGTVADSEISDTLYSLAREYGQTFENVSEIATNFARTGMDWAETIDATRAALLGLNVAELSSEEASNGLIAVMSQFKIEAADLTEVIDKLNKTADNFPVTTEKLLKALQRTGSAAVNANLSLDETVGLITSLSQATGRSGENLGTAINSLIQYSSKSGSLDVFASLSDNTAAVVDRYRKGAADILEVWRAVSEVIQNMNAEQESLLKGLIESDDIQNLESELQDELGDIFETVQDVYGTANTFRKNYFIALLGNMQTVLDAQKVSADAAGYSAKENEEYLKTYEARLNSLTAQWQKLANDEQGILAFKKALLDIGSGLLTIIENTGGLRTTFIALSTVIAAAFGQKIVNAIGTFIKSLRTVKTAAEGATLSLNGVLGVIGLIATAVSALVGVLEDYYRKQEESRKEAIETYNANKENALQLEAYAQKLSETKEGSDEYYKIEKEIVSLLGEKAGALSELTEGTKEYNEKLKELTDLEIKQWKIKKELAREAAETEMNAVRFNAKLGNLLENRYNVEALKKYTDMTLEEPLSGYYGAYEYIKDDYRFSASNTTEASIANYENALKIRENLLNAIDAAREENDETSIKSLQKLFQTADELITAFEAQYETYKDALSFEEQLADALEEINNETEDTNNNLTTQVKTLADVKEEYGKIVDALKAYNAELSEAEKLSEKQNAVLEAQQALEEAIAKTRREDIISALETERKEKEQTLTIEQKQLDVEKARIALEEARNQRNVRVFNAQTGRYEWQANAKNVQSAQDNLDKAISSLNEYVEGQAWDEVINYIKDGNLDSNGIKNILDKWAAYSIGDTTPEWFGKIQNSFKNALNSWQLDPKKVEKEMSALEKAQSELNEYLKTRAWDELYKTFSSGDAITNREVASLLREYAAKGYLNDEQLRRVISIISQTSGVSALDLSKSVYGSDDFMRGKDARIKIFEDRYAPKFDNGGVLSGLGGIKATRGDEVVLAPELAKKILTPTSNERFSAFVKDMGLLFGVSEKVRGGGGTVNNAGNVYNNSNATHYTINGVSISRRDAETHTIIELFDAMGLVPND